jgi:hypothetical protein
MRTPTSARIAAAATVFGGAVALAGSATAVGRPMCGGRVTSAGAGWLQSSVPFPSGAPQASFVTAVAFAPDRLFAGNGTSVMRSDDDGCTWTALAAPAAALAGSIPAPVATLTAVAAPSSATTDGYLYVGGSAGLAAVQQPYLAVSTDSGRTWRSAPSGLPSLGTVTQIAAAGDVPTIAYAVVAGLAGQPGELDATEDGGLTWTKRASLSSSLPLTSLRVNPTVPDQLFALGPTGLVVSNDGGRSFATATGSSSDVSSFDLAVGAGSIEIVQGRASAPRFSLSKDGGRTWHAHPSLVDAREVAIAPVFPAVIASDGQAMFLWFPTAGGYRPTPFRPDLGVPSAVQLTAPTRVGFAAVGVVSGQVVRAVVSLATGSVVVNATPIALLPGGPTRQFPSTLLPVSTALRLPSGAHADVPYQLVLPRTPSPVDVMFLVDTTSSQDPTINGLKQDLAGIVTQLSGLGLDVEFGLADFRDYYPEDGGEPTDYPYRLRRPISRDLPGLARALARLTTGGGGDPPEADLTALFQSTTGAGQVDTGHLVVAPGQQAGYRPGALKLAVIATDSPYHREKGYPTPSWASTVAALRRAGVYQIGLAVETFNSMKPPQPIGYQSRRDEQAMAVATGAVASPGGIDCNGDGQPDVAAGGGMVCDVTIPQPSTVGTATSGVTAPPPPAVHLANAVVSLASTIRDERAVTLDVSGGPASIASLVPSAAAPLVNVRADNLLRYTIRYTCPASTVAATYHLTVTATAGARALTTSTTQLACAAGAVAPLAVAAPMAPGRPPGPTVDRAGPAQPPSGNSNPNPNPNPNPAANPNAGFATREQQQPQVALAGADQGAVGETEPRLAMSRSTVGGRGDAAGPWTVGAAALLASVAAACATRPRWRAAHQRADSRRYGSR